MIRYSLKCGKGHGFEGWFANSSAFDKQAKRGDVTCPKCGNRKVAKALMAPRIAKDGKKRERQPAAPAEAPSVPVARTAEERHQLAAHGEMAAALRKLKTEIESKSEYVGARFSEEARKIHYEEAPARGIHGEATGEEAQALKEEGIEFFRLPVLPEDRN